MATTTVTMIGKCTVKGCKSRRRNEVEARIERGRLAVRTLPHIPSTRGLMSPYSYWDDKAPWVERLVSLYAPTDAAVMPWIDAMARVGWICETHGKIMKLVIVNGTLVEDKACDRRCTTATGPDCECSCAGANHGAAYA